MVTDTIVSKSTIFDTYILFGVGRIEIWDFSFAVLSETARELINFE